MQKGSTSYGMSDHVIVFYFKSPTFKSQFSLLKSENPDLAFSLLEKREEKKKKKKRGWGLGVKLHFIQLSDPPPPHKHNKLFHCSHTSRCAPQRYTESNSGGGFLPQLSLSLSFSFSFSFYFYFYFYFSLSRSNRSGQKRHMILVPLITESRR